MKNTHQSLHANPFLTVTPPDPAADGEAGGGDTTVPVDSSSGGEEITAEDIKKLKEALAKERTRSAQFEKRLRAFDPSQVEEARREAEEARRLKEETERTATTRIAAMQQKSQQEIQEAKREAAEARENARRTLVRVQWQSEFIAADGLTEVSEIDGISSFDILWAQHGRMFEQDDQGLYIKGLNEMPEIDKETGKRVTPSQYFERLRNDRLYSAHFHPVGGSGGGSRAGVTGRVEQAKDLNGMKSIDLISQGLRAQPRPMQK